jgi:hypothetical protein
MINNTSIRRNVGLQNCENYHIIHIWFLYGLLVYEILSFYTGADLMFWQELWCPSFFGIYLSFFRYHLIRYDEKFETYLNQIYFSYIVSEDLCNLNKELARHNYYIALLPARLGHLGKSLLQCRWISHWSGNYKCISAYATYIPSKNRSIINRKLYPVTLCPVNLPVKQVMSLIPDRVKIN